MVKNSVFQYMPPIQGVDEEISGEEWRRDIACAKKVWMRIVSMK
jgi:hypothetical protein